MIRLELLKLRRSHRPWIAAVALLTFLVLMLFGFWLYAKKQTGGQVEFRYTYENESYFNGLTFTVYGFYFGFLLLMPVFLAMEGGAQVAGETDRGVLQLLLTRPVTRTRIFATKALVALGMAAALSLGLLIACLAIGLVAIGWGDLTLYPGVLQMTGSYQHLSQNQALWRLFLVWPFATLALSAPVALSLLISVWMRSAVNAAGTATAAYFVLHVLSGVPFFDDLRPFLFTTYMGSWRELLQEDIDWRLVAIEHGRLLVWTTALSLLAHWRFRRREER